MNYANCDVTKLMMTKCKPPFTTTTTMEDTMQKCLLVRLLLLLCIQYTKLIKFEMWIQSNFAIGSSTIGKNEMKSIKIIIVSAFISIYLRLRLYTKLLKIA